MAGNTEIDPVEVFVKRLRAGRDPSAQETEAVLRLLRVWLSRRGLEPEDREEVCSDAILRLDDVVRDGRLDRNRPAGAWLRVVADHLAIDALRRRRRTAGVSFEEQIHGGGREDDRIAALLDSSAAATDVMRAMRQAADDQELELVRIVATWLGLAAANREAPTTREVGARLGVSHMTVQRALRAFGQRLSR